MSVIRLICISALLVILTLISAACTQSPVGSREGSQRVAEEFVRLETTFRFDGIPETLKPTSTTSVANGWKYTIEFDSRHAGEMVVKVTKKPPSCPEIRLEPWQQMLPWIIQEQSENWAILLLTSTKAWKGLSSGYSRVDTWQCGYSELPPSR